LTEDVAGLSGHSAGEAVPIRAEEAPAPRSCRPVV